MTRDPIPGVHHVTAIAADPQRNIDFYTSILGLRLVKQTVNFDDPTTYHFYYGDTVGTPGSVLTFFPWPGAAPGRVGPGQVSTTSFVIPESAIDFWTSRLDEQNVNVQAPIERFGETVLPFTDPDGLRLELVATDTDIDPWAHGPIPPEHGIRGFHGVSLQSAAPSETIAVLETMELARTDQQGDRVRFRAAGDRACVVDVITGTDIRPGRMGPGTVHHVAFRTRNETTQDAWRDELTAADLPVTPPRDRQYFRSIYFRDPGDILFEIATDGPGFTRDESREALGTTLKLPPWLEDQRESISGSLPDIQIPAPGNRSR